MVSNSLINNGSLPTVWTTTAETQYDALGQIKVRTLGKQKDASGNYTTTPIETLAYEYNIRGWLLGINRGYLSSGSTSSSYFGMELNYDKDGYAPNGSKQYNGNIGAMVWRSQGDGMQRQYQYSYDNLNRLLKGDFTQWDGGTWNNTNANFNVKMGDGSNPLSAYDANGNILRMQQWGLKIGGSAQIDDLTYAYFSNSNKLQTVTDAITADNKMGDFTDKNTSGNDYGYDKNGNLVTDLNKSISGSTGLDLTSGGAVTYNHLNLPQQIAVSGKGTISYVYDAGGGKLQKITSETGATVSYNGGNYTSDITTTTTYAIGVVYESKAYSNNALSALQYTDKLQFLGQDDGRVRVLYTNTTSPNTPTGLAYDYFVKDHLGDVRMVLTEEQQKDIYPAATLEGDPANSSTAAGYESLYYSINSTNIVAKSAATGITDYVNNNGISSVYPAGNSGNTNINSNSQKLYRLNSNSSKTGLGITLKVMAGDKIDIFGKSYYFTNNTGGAPVNSAVPVLEILTGLLGAPGGTGAAATHGAVTASQLNGISATTSGITTLLTNETTDNNNNTNVPKAYINYLFFDNQFRCVGSGFSKIGSNSVVKDHHVDLQNIVVPRNGYVYIYCSNESPVDVFFDNIQVAHTRGAILEETHYYPYGLTMAGISDKALKTSYGQNKFRYNGKELQNGEFSDGSGLEQYDYGARMMDPQLGVWHKIDPMAHNNRMWSPYCYAKDNPLRFIDPDGMDSKNVNSDDPNQMYNYVFVKDNKSGKIYAVELGIAEKGTTESYTSLVDEKGNGLSGTLIDSKGNIIMSTKGSRDIYLADGKGVNNIGKMGGHIDASGFIPNLLAENKARAQKMSEKDWLGHVFIYMEWDYKNNKNTIFGVVWQYDLDARQADPDYINTVFKTKERDYDDAAQFGNFNAGYTGTYAGVPVFRQYMYAGMGEIAKHRSLGDVVRRTAEIELQLPPYGDEWNDYRWNTRGMESARRKE